MTTPQSQEGLSAKEIAKLEKRLEKLSGLSMEAQAQEIGKIHALTMKMTPDQLAALEKRQMAKMTPKQKKRVKQFKQQASEPSGLSAELFDNALAAAFGLVNDKATETGPKNLSLEQRLAIMRGVAEAGQTFAALSGLRLEAAKMQVIAEQQAAASRPAKQIAPGSTGTGQYL